MAVTNLQQFTDSMNQTVRQQLTGITTVTGIAARPANWFTAQCKTDVKAEFAAMVAAAKTSLDECNAWIQSI